jgi:DNA-binding PadR family transcriptional regulator
MSAIRLLILGVLLHREATYGYEIRRTLETWHADLWANLAFGSIYSALATMAADGLVESTVQDQESLGPARKLYQITEQGKEEFAAQLHTFWFERKRVFDPFQVALTFMNHLPSEELVQALQQRLMAFSQERELVEQLRPQLLSLPGVPRHVAENVQLYQAHLQADIAWLESAIQKVKRQELP